MIKRSLAAMLIINKMERNSNRLRTPDKYNSGSIFSSTQIDNRTRTPVRQPLGDSIPERFNYSIESKKKASIIEKISGLAPFLETLINKSEIRSAQIVDRLVELRNQLDDIFEEISSEFEAAQSENDNLRRSLEVVPKQRAQAAAAQEAERLQRILDQLQGELQQARNRESQAAQQLQQLGAQNRESIGVLEDFKRETERLKAANSELQEKIRELSARQLPPGVTPDEIQRIRAELEKERRRSVGLEDDARRRLQDYQQRLQAENKKFRDLESIHAALARKSDLNQEEIRQLKEAIQRQGRKSLSLQENIKRKIQQSEENNTQLKKKIDEDERELQARIRRIQDLEAENAERERKLREFGRKSELNEKEIAQIKAQMEKDRRQSMVNEENLLRKLKQVEDQKKGLLSKANQNEQKAKQYEDILQKLTVEVERDRRQSMAMQKGASDKIKVLEKQNTDLNSAIGAAKNRQSEDERKLRELYESIKEKERKYNQYIQEITRKSTLHEDEIRLIQQELEKERRKSLADQATIKRLERVIDDQTKNTKEQVAMLQAQIENERRKSMADEAAIRKMQQILNEKVYFLNESQKKHGLAQNQIQFLKDQIEKERRKSTADQGVIRKLQQILAQKERYMSEVDRKGKQADDDIRALKQEIQNQRRKSMADEALIKKLQGELAQKIKMANDTHNKYLELARKSEAGDEEIRFLKAEIDKERRKSNADEATIRKLQQLLAEKVRVIEENKKSQQKNDDEIKFLRDQIENQRRKSMADQTKIRKLEDMLKEKIAVAEQFNHRYLEEVRKSEVNAKELQFLMNELEKERRKSTADQATVKRLEKLIAQKVKLAQDMQNRHINQIKILQNEIENQRRKSMADETKIRKLEDILKEKVALAEAQKAQILELARKTDLNENEIRMLQQQIDNERRKSMADVAMIKKLEAVIAEKTRALEDRNNSLFKNNEEIQFLKQEIDKERRKSMADEAQIKKLEQILQAKMDELRDAQRRTQELGRKSNLNEEEIQFLKDQMEKDRRASQVGTDNFMKKVRELEGTKTDLMSKLEEDKQRFIKTANYIKQLEEKNKNAERAIGDFTRKSELNQDEIEKLKAEMDKERRKSVSLEQTFLPKIHLLVDQNQQLVREIEEFKNRIRQADDKIAEMNEELGKARQAIDVLQNQNRNKQRALGQFQRTLSQQANRNQQRLNESVEDKNRIVRDLEGQLNRAKQERSRMQQELNGKVNELRTQRESISNLERALHDKDSNIQESQSNNRALARQLNEMKARERELIDRNNQLAEQTAQTNIIYEQQLQGSLGAPVRGFAKPYGAATATTVVVSETSHQQREHVIKVLEHERRVYKLETALAKQSPAARTEAFDSYSNQDIEPFDEPRQFQGRTSSPVRLQQGGKRTRAVSEV